MEISGLNSMDETSPFHFNAFTSTTNQTNGVVNSSFAKISIPTTPMTQWFDTSNGNMAYKLFIPPADRIRKLKIKLRYHNGRTVNFGVFNYSFTIQFTQMFPQILRKSHVQMFS